MKKRVVIGLVGDYDRSVPAHAAIPLALENAGRALRVRVSHRWIPTDQIDSESRVSDVDGLWCVPGGPYRSMEGALIAIRFAREQDTPLLGTCAGFQHVVIEYARNELAWSDAEHAEVSPDASRAVVSPLECGLLAGEGPVHLISGTRLATAYGVAETAEEYLCRYGVNPRFTSALVAGPLRAAASDERGDLRAVELDGHAFFVATLFQPERAALRGQSAPIVDAFVRACAKRDATARGHAVVEAAASQEYPPMTNRRPPYVKVCCIASIDEARLAVSAGASALGLVSTMPSGPGVIDERLIGEIVATVPSPVATFLLSARQDADALVDQHAVCRTSTLQLVDSVPTSELRKLRKRIPGIKVVQVVHVSHESALEEARGAAAFVDALLLDSGNPSLPVKELGGTGRTHDWQISRRICQQVDRPVFLAGGLNADNVARAIATVRPFGVDLCSGVRTNGALDASKLRAFMRAVRAPESD